MPLSKEQPVVIHPLLQAEYEQLKNFCEVFWCDGNYMEARWLNDPIRHYAYNIRENGTIFCVRM